MRSCPHLNDFTINSIGAARKWQRSYLQSWSVILRQPSFYVQSAHPSRLPLSQDQLTRASAAIGVYKGLHLLFADAMADRWPKLPNRGPIFHRLSPVDAMIEGGIPAMLETRRYIDAVRGGL